MKKKNPAHQARRSPSPVVALLTDFGLEDHYVGTMKAVILSLCPKASIVDVTHEIAPHQVQEAGYVLWSAYKFFPKGTLFVAVVDPGVGSSRKILGVRSRRYTFLAPDNGVLDFVLNEERANEAVEIDTFKSQKYLLPGISDTFHGRDIFAPLAAHLSMGKHLRSFGKRTKLSDIHAPLVKSKGSPVKPCVLHIDHFGNIVTNIMMEEVRVQDIQTIAVSKALVSRWIRTYDEAPEKTPCMIIGSNRLIEIVVKKDNAARLLNAAVSSLLTVYWS